MCRAFVWAGFDSGGLHTLRHTFATRYLQKGGNLEDLRDLLDQYVVALLSGCVIIQMVSLLESD